MTTAKEQAAGLPHAMRYKKVSGGEGCSDMMAVRPDGRWIRAQDYDAALDRIAVKQAEIERLAAIIAVMDASSPRADRTCAEPGITLSQAVEREYPHLASLNTENHQ